MVDTALGASSLRKRLADVRKKIDETARRCNRLSEEITIIAVSKTHPVEAVRQAFAAGVTNFGENRVQEAEIKIVEAGLDGIRWHLIGHLQANKARRAVKLFDVIHTLDSISLAQRLDRLCADESRVTLPVLIQVDLAGEDTKTGVTESELDELLAVVGRCTRLDLQGLMTLPPFFEDPERVRPYFRRLRELRDQIAAGGHFRNLAGDLSMGMSHDFAVAIEEGATLVRIGTAIFGERIKEKLD
ncbi:MAG TPA: YggS family pyridoxal phosphate-dependent enzyme [Pyrinomonadaceae bacterium]|nr:YggS family pyridoxal phosphate-dependent enzyme [Pyrinomonadaceae bacterium]